MNTSPEFIVLLIWSVYVMANFSPGGALGLCCGVTIIVGLERLQEYLNNRGKKNG